MAREKPKIFISHAWEDKDLVRRFEKALKAADIDVWVDHSEVRGGDVFPERVSKALEWCNTFLLIWSKAASTSYWIEREWATALNLNKTIIPCRLDKTDIPGILTSSAYIDFQNLETGIAQLLNALNVRQQPQISTEKKSGAVKSGTLRFVTQQKKKVFLSIAMLLAGFFIIFLFFQINWNRKVPGNEQVSENATTENDTTKRTQLQELEGEIINATTGLPLKDVVVTLPEFRKTATTDTFGRFGFEVNAPFQAQVKLRAHKTGYEPLNRDVTLGGNLNTFKMGKEK